MAKSLKNLVCLVCGGEVVVDESNKIATCKYCKHTFQIGSSLSDNGIINLTLANEYYKTFRFSDSKRKYLEVIAEDKTFSEAYWGAFISEYGIEWGENSFGDIVPTCHRAHTISVFDDKNYNNAIKYSNEESKQEYIELANKIEDIRNEIILKSNEEAEYDVFICFKATEEIDGRKRKTVDYDLGSEIYKKLTSNGYKVFFSPETLIRVKEQEFEPYIFKALNSAKVMLLLCSSNEKIDSAWVKNEWGRFIDMHSGSGLIPVCGNRFENYNPASLPNELRKLNCIEYGVNLYDQILTKIETYFPEKLKEKESELYNNQQKEIEELKRQLAETKKSQEQQKEIEELKRQLEEAKKVGHLTNNMAYNSTNIIVGKTITFGRYKQGSRGEVKPIEWQVLKVGDSKALLISKYALAYKHFNESKVDTTWESCSLRSWLNNEFYEEAFNEVDKQRIVISNIIANKNPKYSTEQGGNTKDKVFLLSINEAKEYFYEDSDRIVSTTDYCNKQSVNKLDKNSRFWWLRSIGCSGYVASNVNNNGGVEIFGTTVISNYGVVRPTIVINLDDNVENVNTTANSVNIGEIITFGNYPQGANGEIAPIEWQVLNVANNQALLISKYALDCEPFNSNSVDVTWSVSSIRNWLNNEFYAEAFNNTEKHKIAVSYVFADNNPYFQTNQGSNTKDKVLLLSIKDIEKYFTNKSSMCVPTEYAKKQGVHISSKYMIDGKLTCWWWLRSSGDYSDSASYVECSGMVNSKGYDVGNTSHAIRPVIKINL